MNYYDGFWNSYVPQVLVFRGHNHQLWQGLGAILRAGRATICCWLIQHFLIFKDGCFHGHGASPHFGEFIPENPREMGFHWEILKEKDDLGEPPFQETSITCPSWWANITRIHDDPMLPGLPGHQRPCEPGAGEVCLACRPWICQGQHGWGGWDRLRICWCDVKVQIPSEIVRHSQTSGNCFRFKPDGLRMRERQQVRQLSFPCQSISEFGWHLKLHREFPVDFQVDVLKILSFPTNNHWRSPRLCAKDDFLSWMIQKATQSGPAA